MLLLISKTGERDDNSLLQVEKEIYLENVPNNTGVFEADKGDKKEDWTARKCLST